MMINFDYLSNIFCIIIHQIYSNDNNGQGLNFLATHHRKQNIEFVWKYFREARAILISLKMSLRQSNHPFFIVKS